MRRRAERRQYVAIRPCENLAVAYLLLTSSPCTSLPQHLHALQTGVLAVLYCMTRNVQHEFCTHEKLDLGSGDTGERVRDAIIALMQRPRPISQ